MAVTDIYNMRTQLVSRYFRFMRAFFTFSAIGFIQFVNPSAAADPACKMTPETWTETQSKAQGAKENKAGKKAVPDLARLRQTKFLKDSDRT